MKIDSKVLFLGIRDGLSMGESNAEIAQRMGLTETVVAQRVYDLRNHVQGRIGMRPSRRIDLASNLTAGDINIFDTPARPIGPSPRQKQIADLVALGHSTAEISQTLGIANNTVTNLKYRFRNKIRETEKDGVVTDVDLLLAASSVSDQKITGIIKVLSNHEELSMGEREAIALAAGGLTDKEIARKLNVSNSTVSKRLSSAADKLGFPPGRIRKCLFTFG